MPSYTTKAKVENYLALTIDNPLNEQIDEWIKAVSNWINNYTGRTFEAAGEATVMKYDGNGEIRLPIDDCTEITKLVIDEQEISSDDYYLYPANEPVKTSIELKQGIPRNSRFTEQAIFVFEKGQQNVEVTAKFGWNETPPDIALAATKLMGGIVKEAVGDHDVKELTSEALGDYRASYAGIADIAHALKVQELLAPYLKNKGARTGAILI